MKAAICAAIPKNSADPSSQFKILVCDPLRKESFSMSMVIIFDGIDEYANSAQFLDILVKHFPSLSIAIKLIITSRPEGPILSRMTKLKAK